MSKGIDGSYPERLARLVAEVTTCLMTMRGGFHAQPFEDGVDLRDFLEQIAAAGSLSELTVVVAWAKERALLRFESALRAVRDRGSTRLIVGIDEGGATQQGLEQALRLFDEVYVFHDRSGRTFHPKVYFARGTSDAQLFVGSHNLTPGGIFFNYEAAISLVLDLGEEDDARIVSEVEDFVGRILDDSGACLRLDDDLLKELIENPRYRVLDEYASRRSSAKTGDDVPDSDVDLEGEPGPEGAGPSVFAPSSTKKRSGIPLPGGPDRQALSGPKQGQTAESSDGAESTASPVGPTTGTPATGSRTVVARWFKKLTISDAQQKGTANTKITGNIRLAMAGHPINHQSYFRHELFGGEAWAGTTNEKGLMETAVISSEVIVRGADMGQMEFRLDHADFRVANQSNTPTWLHWDGLSGHMKATNHVGEYLTIERFADGGFRLTIDGSPAGPFL